ncbi:hypothetical protein ACFPLB_01940 [Aquamicrobium segne]|uniref:Uncharacterized protein n=1 Tax=Aquamicrobium segne TaxID=469547 RepID=A0ABW0GU27_9HYPH
MMHFRPTHGAPFANGAGAAASSHHYELAGRVEALTVLVSRAKRLADESLARANDAPQPHETTNIIFVTLYEAHWRDREALFEAMRRLDEAREELQTASQKI